MKDDILSGRSIEKSTLAADDLSKELHKYKTLIRESNTGAWEYFLATDVLWCNDVYFSMLGRDIGDFNTADKQKLKTAWADLLHPDDKSKAIGGFAEYLKNPSSGMYESYFRMRHLDNRWIWIWSRGRVLYDKDEKNADIFIGTHVDVTAQKQSEETIRQERILLRTLIDNLPDVIYIKDAEARKIIANDADVISIGAESEAAVIGKTDMELFPENINIALRGYEDDMSVLKEGRSILNKEEFFFDSSGNKRWLLTSKVPVCDEFGKVNRLLGIGHDITARKQAEEMLNALNLELSQQSEELSRQAADLKTLNEQLSQQKEQELEKAIAQGKFEIASEVLHDIGNAIVGFGAHLSRISRALEQNKIDTIKNLGAFLKAQQSLLSQVLGADKATALVTIAEGVAKTQGDNRAEIDTSITELLNIITHIQEILNIQRQFVRGHGGVHERKPVNLVNIIDDCKSMLFASFDKHGIHFNIKIKPGTYVIKGDHTKLMQVILNILKNSLEAMPFDAPEKNITLAMDAYDDLIELKLIDNGSGFDEETNIHLCERGFTTKKSGTGLGLYNCRSIVESHMGSFEIKSDGPGLGAVTTIKFALQ
ncbi:MAG: ATP-binding protein [Mucilaginibacter sp.]|uniref:ATP-binding protein n=1 Tax=Mucilaginibacter sp. TaxID=1882438 RepID=UPI003267AC2F